MKLPFIIKVNFVSVIRLFRKYILRRKIQKRNFGYIQDHFDDRDVYYRLRTKIKNLPESTNKRNINAFPYRYDQKSLGSCVGNGTAAGFRRSLQTNRLPDMNPSRLFAYYIARTDENKDIDSGACIRDCFKAVNNYGLCHETVWPYITERFAQPPPKNAWEDALNHQSIVYERIYPIAKNLIMDALNNGYSIVFGIILHDSFMSEKVARTGIVTNPRCWEEEIGGHCMLMTDYDRDGVWVLNSWGENWGQGGICHIAWDYILSGHASDFWTFHAVEG